MYKRVRSVRARGEAAGTAALILNSRRISLLSELFWILAPKAQKSSLTRLNNNNLEPLDFCAFGANIQNN